jgi:hypothetical protein
MKTLLAYSTILFTIMFSFVFGIAVGYAAIVAILRSFAREPSVRDEEEAPSGQTAAAANAVPSASH